MIWKKADDGTWSVGDVPLFGPGKWNGGEWTEEFCKALVEKTQAFIEAIKPRLVPGHPREDLDEAGYRAWLSQQPRLGLVENLRFTAGKVWADIKQVPGRVKEAIDAGEWGAMSIVIKRHEGVPVIDNVGLLGAAAPAVPYAGVDAFSDHPYLVFMLGAIPASATTEGSQTTAEGGQTTQTSGETMHPASRDASAPDSLRPTADAKEGTLGDENKAGVEALAEKEARIAELEAAARKRDEEFQAFAQKVKRDRLETAWTRIVESGKATPAMKDSFIDIGMGLDDSTVHQFSEGKEKGTRLDQHIRAWEEREPMQKRTSPKSAGAPEEEGDYEDRALSFAEKYVADGKGSLAQGLGVFQKAHSEDEYKAYRKQFAGAAPSEVTTAAAIIKGGK